ncbi:MAG: SDR family NAD(P)-dependent oxidoreductase [Chloroflexi bacterium]|nr:SDR family NAD(P)-dependent oxidoreductase [Chloroflexota bacterium]
MTELAGKTVLVTGATGFLGGALVRRLAKDGAQVRALVRSPEKTGWMHDLPGVELVPGDITDAARMQAVCANCTVVIHAAAALGGNLAHQQRVNVIGTQHVVQAAAATGVERLVHISSLAVYGYRRQAAVVTEELGPAPTYDAYSLTKSAAEGVVRDVASRSGLAYTILRAGGIYGPHARYWTVRLFKLAQRQPLIMPGQGRGTVPLIYVDDLLDLCAIVATHPAAVNETYNAAYDPPPTMREYLDALARLAGHPVRWLALPVWPVRLAAKVATLGARPGTRRGDLPGLMVMLTHYTVYSMAKARAQLGWQPPTDLATGIQRSAAWLREQGLLEHT